MVRVVFRLLCGIIFGGGIKREYTYRAFLK